MIMLITRVIFAFCQYIMMAANKTCIYPSPRDEYCMSGRVVNERRIVVAN